MNTWRKSRDRCWLTIDASLPGGGSSVLALDLLPRIYDMQIATTDREFLLAAGIEPYEPDEFEFARSGDVREKVIKTIAIVQFVAIVISLIWMSA